MDPIFNIHVNTGGCSGIIQLMDSSATTIMILVFVWVIAVVGAVLSSTAGRSRIGTLVRAVRITGKRPLDEAPVVDMPDPPEPTPEEEPREPQPEISEVPPQEQPIWYVPHARDEAYVARDKIIDEVHSALISRRKAALVEMGQAGEGVGKTQLAAEYAYRFFEDYSVVWWLRASHPSLLAADYMQLLSALGLQIDGACLEQIRQYVSLGLARRGSWLLIFDDAASLEALREHLPGADNGHIIITSQDSNWWPHAVPVTVGGFEHMQSIEMIFARTKQPNGAVAAQVASLFQDLPLAIDQACAYVRASSKLTDEYLTLVRSRKSELGFQVPERMDRNQIIAVTVSLSIEQASKEANGADALLNVLAFFTADPIPVRLLREAMNNVAIPGIGSGDSAALDSALAALQRYALAEVSNENVFVHGLVQTAARAALGERDCSMWAELAVRLNREMFRFDGRDLSSRQDCSAMLPHALAAVSYAEALGVVIESESALLEEVVLFLRACGELEEARKTAGQALAITEIVFGSAHPRAAVCADILGSILHQMGDFAGAKDQYERVLKIDQAAYGPQHPTVAAHMGNLGDVLCKLENYAQARAYLERALRIAENTYGYNHTNVAVRAGGLARALSGLGELGAAKALLERALAIEEASYGPTHPCVAESVHALGRLHAGLGDIDQAIECFDRALKIVQAIYGHDHPCVAVRVAQLGELLESDGDLKAAKDCYEEALGIDEVVYGMMHPLLVGREEALGRLLEKMGDYAAAAECYRLALVIQMSMLGPDHPNVADSAIRLGNAYAVAGDLLGARDQYEQAADIHQAIHGPTHPGLADDLLLLANVLNDLGDFKTARLHLGRALVIRQETLGLSHPDTESVRQSLADLAA